MVLWALALLALLATQLTSSARSSLQLAANARTAAVLEAQADGLLYGAVFQLMGDSAGQRRVDGLERTVAVAGGQGTVRIDSLAGKVNPNTAAPELLAALLAAVGVAEQPAARLAAAIADWHTPGQMARPLGGKAAAYRAAGLAYAPPGAPFEGVEELGHVLGMTPDVLARLAPHLSVFYPGDPVPAAADPVVLRVLQALDAGDVEAPMEGTETDSVYAQVSVRVRQPGGAAFSRRAVVWAGHGALRGQYRVLQWDVPGVEGSWLFSVQPTERNCRGEVYVVDSNDRTYHVDRYVDSA